MASSQSMLEQMLEAAIRGGGLANGGAGGEPETDPASGRTQSRQRPPSGLPQQQAEVSPGSGMGDLARYGGLAVIGVLAYQAL